MADRTADPRPLIARLVGELGLSPEASGRARAALFAIVQSDRPLQPAAPPAPRSS